MFKNRTKSCLPGRQTGNLTILLLFLSIFSYDFNQANLAITRLNAQETLISPIQAVSEPPPTTISTTFYLPFLRRPFDMVRLIPFVSGLVDVTDLAHAQDGRLFATEKSGLIQLITASGTLQPAPFLDISERVTSDNFEEGLLSLAFHPDFASNGYFYVYYINLDGDAVLARFEVDGADPNLADAGSESILLTLDQPTPFHEGGALRFGPLDGYLYISTGDGGPPGDPNHNGQSGTVFLGKVLRLDVDGAFPYAIPPDNPFVADTTVLDEIWALGLRNPWRISFDSLTGDLYIADVGEGLREEINWQSATDTGGHNYGWRCYEGTFPFTIDNSCDNPVISYTLPIHEYDHGGGGCSVIGGYVYRGTAWPIMDGHYFFADFCTSNIWSLHQNGAGSWSLTKLGDFGWRWSTFGEGSDGELYIAALGHGTIYQLAPGP